MYKVQPHGGRPSEQSPHPSSHSAVSKIVKAEGCPLEVLVATGLVNVMSG